MHSVLIIEDEIAHLILLREVLQTEPALTLIEADTGKQGLVLARAKRPDLVLVDARLPDMDGVEVARLIKADLALKGTRVMFVTVVADLASKWLPDADAFMLKPYEDAVLLANVRQLLGIGHASAPSAAN
jgi:two-component system, cell cycle response regulator